MILLLSMQHACMVILILRTKKYFARCKCTRRIGPFLSGLNGRLIVAIKMNQRRSAIVTTYPFPHALSLLSFCPALHVVCCATFDPLSYSATWYTQSDRNVGPKGCFLYTRCFPPLERLYLQELLSCEENSLFWWAQVYSSECVRVHVDICGVFSVVNSRSSLLCIHPLRLEPIPEYFFLFRPLRLTVTWIIVIVTFYLLDLNTVIRPIAIEQKKRVNGWICAHLGTILFCGSKENHLGTSLLHCTALQNEDYADLVRQSRFFFLQYGSFFCLSFHDIIRKYIVIPLSPLVLVLIACASVPLLRPLSFDFLYITLLLPLFRPSFFMTHQPSFPRYLFALVPLHPIPPSSLPLLHVILCLFLSTLTCAFVPFACFYCRSIPSHLHYTFTTALYHTTPNHTHKP